jgi:hypothetical protein
MDLGRIGTLFIK